MGSYTCVYHPRCYNASTSLRHPGWKLRRGVSSLEVKRPTKGRGLQKASHRVRSTGAEVSDCCCAYTALGCLVRRCPGSCDCFFLQSVISSLFPSSRDLVLGDSATAYVTRRGWCSQEGSGFWVPLGIYVACFLVSYLGVESMLRECAG